MRDCVYTKSNGYGFGFLAEAYQKPKAIAIF